MSSRRFISTCVETANNRWRSGRSPSVHLHVCGDSLLFKHLKRQVFGSSPRVWRQPVIPRCRGRRSRFISTCVETAGSRQKKKNFTTVHLHVCGDSNSGSIVEYLIAGSSPRVWRQLRMILERSTLLRFISTCVETAAKSSFLFLYPAVHLHVCGDSAKDFLHPGSSVGSSPRVWRQLEGDLFPLELERFISTCVETACLSSSIRPLTAVHLHVCGDSRHSPTSARTQNGSSPRVWRQPS